MNDAAAEAPPEIQTRELLVSDYPLIAKLWEEADGVEITEGDSPEEIGRYLSRNPGLSRVALDGAKVAGAVLCGHDGRRGFIYHLAVAPTYRGCGIAKLLVGQCMAGLRAAGIARAIILVAADNPGGRAFWLRNEWEDISGAVAMARDVA